MKTDRSNAAEIVHLARFGARAECPARRLKAALAYGSNRPPSPAFPRLCASRRHSHTSTRERLAGLDNQSSQIQKDQGSRRAAKSCRAHARRASISIAGVNAAVQECRVEHLKRCAQRRDADAVQFSDICARTPLREDAERLPQVCLQCFEFRQPMRSYMMQDYGIRCT